MRFPVIGCGDDRQIAERSGLLNQIIGLLTSVRLPSRGTREIWTDLDGRHEVGGEVDTTRAEDELALSRRELRRRELLCYGEHHPILTVKLF